MRSSELTQILLRELFYYDEKSGKLYRRKDGKEVGTKLTLCHKYKRVSVSGKPIRLHIVIWIYVYGQYPKKGEIDHIDTDKTNNRIDNLRAVTRSKNQINKACQSNNTSEFKGVVFRKRIGKWEARIGVNGKRIHLGDYVSKNLAALAYNRAATYYYGSRILLNKVPSLFDPIKS